MQPYYLFIILTIITSILLSQMTYASQTYELVIPQWIKNNAKWWADGEIGDTDFLKGIQYLVQNGVIKAPLSQGGYTSTSKQIPSWIKNSAGWWANGTIDDSEFVKGIGYLVQSGIIQIGSSQTVNQTANTPFLSNQTISNQLSNAIPTLCNAINGGVLPDPTCTPGATDPRVTQDNIDSTICVPGYTKTVRPPVSYTEPLKFKIMDAYGHTDSAGNYELDHLIPLELGGAPSDVRNLWPEPHYTTPNSYDKDTLENYLHRQVCSGTIELQTAQKEIVSNWVRYWAEISNQSNFDNPNDPDGDQPTAQTQNATGILHTDLQGSTSIVRGNVQSMTVIVTDGTNPVSDASVSIHVTYASGYTTKDFDGITNSKGRYDFSWKIGANSDPGTFQVDVSVSKNDYSSTNDTFSFEVTEN